MNLELKKLPNEEEILRIIGSFADEGPFKIPIIDADKFIDLAKAITRRIEK